MKKLFLSGYVGYDITSFSVKQLLDEAKGEEIEVHLNTQGGNIYEGIAVYDLIDKYEGKKTCILGGLVASIGSYIATAFPKVIAQDISIFMVHNASNCVCGDYKDMQNESEALFKLNAHIADRLSRFTGKTSEDMLKLMDDESWYYGKEILDAGFATDFIETGKTAEQPSNVLEIEKIKFHNRLKSVAAYFGEPPTKPKEEKVMEIKEFLENAKNFVKSGDFKLDDALDLFGAKDKLITDKQLEALNELGDADVKQLKEKALEAEQLVVNAAMTEAFGETGDLREYANDCLKLGLAIDAIKTKPLAIKLAAERAKGIETVENRNDKKKTDGKKRVSY